MSSVLSLEKFAAVSARLDAGLPRDGVLRDAGLNQQQWEVELSTWLPSLAEQVQRHNYELYQRYTQWFLQYRLEAERQLGLQSAPLTAAAAPPAARNDSGDWEYMRWNQAEAAAGGSPAAPVPPPLVAPPALVGGVPAMPSIVGVPAMPPIVSGVPPMPSVSAIPPMPNSGVPAMPPVSAVPPMPGAVAAPPPPYSAPPYSAPPAVSAQQQQPESAATYAQPAGVVAPPAMLNSQVSAPPFVSPGVQPVAAAPGNPGYFVAAASAAPPASQSYVPELSLGDYAMLTAELDVVPEQAERALAKYGISDAQAWQSVQQTWGQKLGADGYEMESYRERFESAKRHWRAVYKR